MTLFDHSDIGFVHISDYTHLTQIICNSKQGRGIEARSHSLSLLNLTIDHHSVDRRSNRRISQILPHTGHIRLGLFVVAFRRLVLILGRLVIRVADHVFLVQTLDPIEVLLLILILRLIGLQGCRTRLEFGLQRRPVEFSDDLALLDDRIIIHVDIFDDTGYLSTHLHLNDRFDRSRGGHGIHNRPTTYLGRLVAHLLRGLRSGGEQVDTYGNHNHHQHRNQNFLHCFHIAFF